MEIANVDCFGPFDGQNNLSILGIEEHTKPKWISKQLPSASVPTVYFKVNRRLDTARFLVPAQTTYNESSRYENTDFPPCNRGIKDLRSTAGSLAD